MIVDAIYPVWQIALILVPLTILLLWNEWRRTLRSRILRMLSILIMMISVAGILLKPTYNTKKSSSLFLLTSGYSVRKVDSILRSGPKLVVMHTENATPYKNSELLPFHDLMQRGKEIRMVLGEGLPAHALDLLENKVFDFIPAPLPEGITALLIPQVAQINRKNFIGGVFNSKRSNVQIYLNGPGGREDSVSLSHKGLSDFKLSFIPKQSGNLLYTLSIKDSTAAVQKENLPVYVEEDQHLNILFMQHYPTFETQYLKSFLKRKNQSVVLRNQLSKNNFRYEYINHEPLQINKLTMELLAHFDLLITDQGTLQTLSPAERNILEKSIRSGLGLLNLAGDIKIKGPNAFMPFETKRVKPDTAVIRMGSKSFNLPASPWRASPGTSIVHLQKNKSGILSGYSFDGAGKIAFQFLLETYRLALSGDSAVYSELWTSLIEQVSKPKATISQIKILNTFPLYENDPVDIEIISSNENVSLFEDSIRLPLKEDVNVDDVWYARTWAGSPGWHTLKTDDGTSMPYYISYPNEWKSLSIANQLEANKIIGNRTPENAIQEIPAQKEIPALLFYLTFLVAAGFAWLSPKL